MTWLSLNIWGVGRQAKEGLGSLSEVQKVIMGWSNGETDRRDRGHIEICGKGPVDTMGTRTGMTSTPSRWWAVTSLNYAALKYVRAFRSAGWNDPVVSRGRLQTIESWVDSTTLQRINHARYNTSIFSPREYQMVFLCWRCPQSTCEVQVTLFRPGINIHPRWSDRIGTAVSPSHLAEYVSQVSHWIS